MLQIRPEQMQALVVAQQHDFIQRCARHLDDCATELRIDHPISYLSDVGLEKLTKVVRHLTHHGFKKETDFVAAIEFIELLGASLPRRKVRRIIEWHEHTISQRLDLLRLLTVGD